MLVNLIVYFNTGTPVSILTTEQAVLDAVHETKNLGFFLVKGTSGDCLIVPKFRIFNMVYIQIAVKKYADKKREGEGEKSVKPSEE